jgi:glycopeptide antibiotics resistance protein
LIGILIYALLRPLRRKTYRSDFGLLKIPLILYAIFLAFYSLQPFDWAAFTISEQTLQRERTLPRLVFPGTTQVWDLQDTLGALVAFMPFTLYWTYNWRVRGMDWERIYWRSLLATAAWGLLIEGIQLFSSSRVAALSDIVSYSIGGVLGVLMVHYYALRVEPIHASRSRHIP